VFLHELCEEREGIVQGRCPVRPAFLKRAAQHRRARLRADSARATPSHVNHMHPHQCTRTHAQREKEADSPPAHLRNRSRTGSRTGSRTSTVVTSVIISLKHCATLPCTCSHRTHAFSGPVSAPAGLRIRGREGGHASAWDGPRTSGCWLASNLSASRSITPSFSSHYQQHDTLMSRPIHSPTVGLALYGRTSVP
jgi:hypothetical protein